MISTSNREIVSSIDPQDYYDPQHSIEFTSP